ncbi:sodium:calcium antiporter [Candidatus Microgenomates bacterium]|nr:sodium:calcium antiporter [Candidatus Microgenomates bacterium]
MEQILLTFIIGVLILLYSTQRFVRLAENISLAFKISPLIIGTTIVALGTSVPELTVSTVSSFNQDFDLAVANIIGSNIANIFLVLAIGILIGKLRIGTVKTQRNAVILIGATVLFFLVYSLGLPHQFAALILLSTAAVISIAEYSLGVLGRNHEDLSRFKKLTKVKIGSSTLLSLVIFICGIILGGYLIVSSVEVFSKVTGISTSFLGLTLTAIVTSLPELFTTVLSQKDHEEKIAIGNILGSNIYNLVFIGGVIMLFPISVQINPLDWIWLAGATACAFLVIKKYAGKQPPKLIAAAFLTLFLVYLYTISVV